MVRLIYLLFLLYYLPTNTVLADSIIKEQSFPTSGGKTLYVKANCGDVNVITWNKDEAYIKISGNDNAKNAFKFEMEEKNGNIYVTVSSPNTKSYNNISLKIEASVPGNYNSEISSSGGDLSFYGISGNLVLKTAGGNIKIDNSSGKSEIKTAGGDILINSFSGEINAKTSGGDVQINNTSGKISAKTSGGNMKLVYSGDNKGIDLSTSGGNIHLYLPDDFSANANLITSGGEIKCDFEVKGKIDSHKSMIKGKINNGSEVLSCKTNGGNIIIEKTK